MGRGIFRRKCFVSISFDPILAPILAQEVGVDFEYVAKKYCESILQEGVVKQTYYKLKDKLVFECRLDEGINTLVSDRLITHYADYLGAIDIGFVQKELIEMGIGKKLPFSLKHLGGYGLSLSSTHITGPQIIAGGMVKYGFYRDDMVILMCKAFGTGQWDVAFGIPVEYPVEFVPILVAPVNQLSFDKNLLYNFFVTLFEIEKRSLIKSQGFKEFTDWVFIIYDYCIDT